MSAQPVVNLDNFDRNAFREELKKRMPGFRWVVRRIGLLEAEGSQSSGSNRTATLIVRPGANGWYTASFYGYGLRAAQVATADGQTVAQALRCLQDQMQRQGSVLCGAAETMQAARAIAAATGQGGAT